MSLPESKSDLQRSMGMVNYVGKFTPNLSQITAPLRQLLKKDVLFDLQQPQLNAINETGLEITAGVTGNLAPPKIWPPRAKFPRKFGPGGPYFLVNMAPRSEIWPPQ